MKTIYLLTFEIGCVPNSISHRLNLSFDVFTVDRQTLAVDSDLEDICRDFAVIVDTEVLELERWIKRAAKESAANFINELEKNDK